MGHIQKPSVKSYISKNPIYTAVFYRTMVQDRFEIKLDFCILWTISPVVKHINVKYKTSYKMSENITVDESLTLEKKA